MKLRSIAYIAAVGLFASGAVVPLHAQNEAAAAALSRQMIDLLVGFDQESTSAADAYLDARAAMLRHRDDRLLAALGLLLEGCTDGGATTVEAADLLELPLVGRFAVAAHDSPRKDRADLRESKPGLRLWWWPRAQVEFALVHLEGATLDDLKTLLEQSGGRVGLSPVVTGILEVGRARRRLAQGGGGFKYPFTFCLTIVKHLLTTLTALA